MESHNIFIETFHKTSNEMSSPLSSVLGHHATTFPGKTLRWHQLLE